MNKFLSQKFYTNAPNGDMIPVGVIVAEKGNDGIVRCAFALRALRSPQSVLVQKARQKSHAVQPGQVVELPLGNDPFDVKFLTNRCRERIASMVLGDCVPMHIPKNLQMRFSAAITAIIDPRKISAANALFLGNNAFTFMYQDPISMWFPHRAASYFKVNESAIRFYPQTFDVAPAHPILTEKVEVTTEVAT